MYVCVRLLEWAACWELALVVAGMFPIMVSVGWIQMRVTKGVGGRGKDAFEVVSWRVGNPAHNPARFVAGAFVPLSVFWHRWLFPPPPTLVMCVCVLAGGPLRQ